MTEPRRTLFQRLFPNSIGASLRDFLFGVPCPVCAGGSQATRWQRYDGTGSWRMHRTGYFPDTYEIGFCKRNGWLSRHWFATALIVTVIGLSILTGITVARAADPPLPTGYSCADVRAAVEKYGKAKAIRLAKRKGATAEQLAAAEKCL